ncbi:hypothetical protein EV44_g3414 [Erysiphe necator]|uniref:Uncharacterized protein n=1 Tax=Uncinula necator TaxID=52586 RepID=A0A0B1P561_UNCNE|nr:hypothetical protein EV44_g3414 [Erysiphe necator]
MAPTATRRAPLPEPPEAVNRITKHKATVRKPSSSSKSSRMLPFTTEALRKAGVIDKTLGSKIPTKEIIESMDIQIDSAAGKTSLSAINLSQQPVLENLNDKTEITAAPSAKQNFRLASIDPDYPGPHEKLFDEPLNYNETPPPACSIGGELNNVTVEATQRVTDAKLIFGPVASILDSHCSQAPITTYHQSKLQH